MHLELGGKDAFIVCDDVDLEVAARGAVWAAYLNTGQVCTSAERFYVLPEVYDDFVDAFVAETEKLIVGDPMEDATDIGPMVRDVQRDKVEAQLEIGREHPAPGSFTVATEGSGNAASSSLPRSWSTSTNRWT